MTLTMYWLIAANITAIALLTSPQLILEMYEEKAHTVPNDRTFIAALWLVLFIMCMVWPLLLGAIVRDYLFGED